MQIDVTQVTHVTQVTRPPMTALKSILDRQSKSTANRPFDESKSTNENRPPTIEAYLRSAAQPCPVCQSPIWWRSRAGVLLCICCDPAADASLVHSRYHVVLRGEGMFGERRYRWAIEQRDGRPRLPTDDASPEDPFEDREPPPLDIDAWWESLTVMTAAAWQSLELKAYNQRKSTIAARK